MLGNRQLLVFVVRIKLHVVSCLHENKDSKNIGFLLFRLLIQTKKLNNVQGIVAWYVNILASY